MGMKKLAALVMALVLCLCAVSAMAEIIVSGANGASADSVNGEYNDFQLALNAVGQENLGDVIVKLGSGTYRNEKHHFSVTQYEGTNITIQGSGESTTINGKIDIHGQGRNTGKETITIQNIRFDATGVTGYVIGRDVSADDNSYPHNITVKNCSFVGNGKKNKESITAVCLRESYGTTNISDCEADNFFAFYYGIGGSPVLIIDNVTVTNCVEGVSHSSAEKVTIKNSSFETDSFAIRTYFKPGKPMRLTVTNNTIVAQKPIVLYSKNEVENSIVIEKNRFPSTTRDQIDRVVTYNEYATPSDNVKKFIADARPQLKENGNSFVVEMRTEDDETYKNDIVYPGYGNVVLKSTDLFEDFVSVSLYHNDKKIVTTTSFDEPFMKIEEGSIKVTIKEEAIQDIGYGTYKLEIVSKGGKVEGTFVYNAPYVDMPKTGDNSSMMLWASMMVIAMVGFAYVSRKTRLN